MSHTVYNTRAIVLKKIDTSEADSTLWLLTSDLGLVVARAIGVRRESAKMRTYLQTLCVTYVSLVRGRYMWRLTGAEYRDTVYAPCDNEARAMFARVANFVCRMTVPSEDVHLFTLLSDVRIELDSNMGLRKLRQLEIITIAKMLMLLGHMPLQTLDNATNIHELTKDINKAISESHL